MKSTILDTQFPENTYIIKSEIASGRLDPARTFFILLPGNMGAQWQGTNHNVGYELLADLGRYYKAVGSKDPLQDFLTPFEKITFNTKELGDDTDFFDTQEFYSEPGYARTRSGEIFLARGSSTQPTLVFMRRFGFYNDVGDFFVPAIREMGGRPENIIVVHDDLSIPAGSLHVEVANATYNGNRAILSIHNNLNAQRLVNQFGEARTAIATILFGSIQEALRTRDNQTEDLLWSLQRATWQVVVDLKNQADPVQFKAALFKSLKPFIEAFVRAQIAIIEPQVTETIALLTKVQSEISAAADKPAAAKNYQELKRKLSNENPLLNDYYEFQRLLVDISSKKGEVLNQITNLFAKDFDPRVMTSPFSRIGVGTGYQEWVKEGQTKGFPELPMGIDVSETGSFPHFVLSPRDPAVFHREHTNHIISRLNELIDY